MSTYVITLPGLNLQRISFLLWVAWWTSFRREIQKCWQFFMRKTKTQQVHHNSYSRVAQDMISYKRRLRDAVSNCSDWYSFDGRIIHPWVKRLIQSETLFFARWSCYHKNYYGQLEGHWKTRQLTSICVTYYTSSWNPSVSIRTWLKQCRTVVSPGTGNIFCSNDPIWNPPLKKLLLQRLCF